MNSAYLSPYAQNFFIVNHRREHKFVAIAKAGSTTLKRITVLDDQLSQDGSENIQETHDLLGYKVNDYHLIDISSSLFPDYTRVAVYRDPVERFISFYKDKILNSSTSHARKAGLTPETPLEVILEYIEQELKNPDPLWIDEHIRPQARHYRPEQVDIIVKLSDLNDYLYQIGIDTVDKGYYNSSSSTVVDLPQEIQNQIKHLYNEDYQLLKNNRKKTWLIPQQLSLFSRVKQKIVQAFNTQV